MPGRRFPRPSLPDEHRAPLLKWFRGLEIEVMKAESQFAVHGFLDIERSELPSSLPTFDLFGGFGSIFGGNKSDSNLQEKPDASNSKEDGLQNKPIEKNESGNLNHK